MMKGSFLVFFLYFIIGDVAKMSDRPMKNSGNVFRLSCFKQMVTEEHDNTW